MFENISHFFRRIVKPEQKELGSKDAAKERLHLVLMQDRANVSADFLELMKQEIIDVIKKYIVVDESSIDVRLTNKSNDDGTNGAPALYANIPIVNIKNDMMAEKEKKFEGVDFNKEMGITPFTEEEIAEKVEEHVEIQPIPGQQIEENKTAIIENYNEKNEDIEDFIEDDEESDDDVTFDDLLKAAEEEERANKEKNESENITSAEKIETNLEIKQEFDGDTKEANIQIIENINEDGKEKSIEVIENINEDGKEESIEIIENINEDQKNSNIEKNEDKKTKGRKKKKASDK